MKFEIEHGSFSYDADKTILRDVCIRLDDAEIMTVLGANGVGKTTLMKCMLGLIPWTVGRTMVDGEDIRKMDHAALWRRISYVPQAKQTAFAYTVEEMVLLGRSAHLGLARQPRAEDRRIVRDCLEEIGIAHLKNKSISRISGGELQMTLIARALATGPSMMILDEPESNLDFRNQLIVMDTIAGLRREKGISFIVNTHYPEHALAVSDKALLLMGDGVSLHGKSAAVMTEENLRRAFSVEVCIRDFYVRNEKYTCVVPLKPA